MYHFPIPTLFLDIQDADAHAAWTALQEAVGPGLLSAVVHIPEQRGITPRLDDITAHPDAPAPDLDKARGQIEAFVRIWRRGLDTLLNRRWDLAENPYAKMWIMPGAIVIHVETLGWEVDHQALAIAGEEDFTLPSAAVLLPLPTSAHGLLAAARPPQMAHAAILDAMLTDAARQENHHAITPLAWRTEAAAPDASNTISL